MTKIDVLLRKLQEHFGVTNDRQLARKLGLAPNSVSTWRVRGNIPWELVCKIADRDGLSLDDLLLGKLNIEQYWRYPEMLHSADDKSIEKVKESWASMSPWTMAPLSRRHHIILNKEHCANPFEIPAVIRVKDDAMSPLFNPNDLVQILLAASLHGPGVYGLQVDNVTTFRRLIPTTGSNDIDVIPENPSFPREKITDPRALRIIGKVECVLHYL